MNCQIISKVHKLRNSRLQYSESCFFPKWHIFTRNNHHTFKDFFHCIDRIILDSYVECVPLLFFLMEGEILEKAKQHILKFLYIRPYLHRGVPGITFHFNNYTFVFLLYFIICIFSTLLFLISNWCTTCLLLLFPVGSFSGTAVYPGVLVFMYVFSLCEQLKLMIAY